MPNGSSKEDVCYSFERALRVMALIPKALCAAFVLIIIMAFAWKASILSNRNNDSYWWHFGELHFYALDDDFWVGFVISVGIVIGMFLVLLVCYGLSAYYAHYYNKRKQKHELAKLSGANFRLGVDEEQ